ncbi:hypothetical protein [Sinomonas flava]|uniref:hypothetical protein n=1 Tax=Sinomonas flava TaxID=496857 RepID=UPI0039A4E2C7
MGSIEYGLGFTLDGIDDVELRQVQGAVLERLLDGKPMWLAAGQEGKGLTVFLNPSSQLVFKYSSAPIPDVDQRRVDVYRALIGKFGGIFINHGVVPDEDAMVDAIGEDLGSGGRAGGDER